MESIKRVSPNGNIVYENERGLYHREDGPAVVYQDGSKSWLINGQFHREDGPAIIDPDGYKSYWLNGTLYSYEEWLDRVTNHISIKWREYCESN